MSVDRNRLYDEVWAEPMTTVAKRYEVSSSFLARVCARLNIPRPPRGFWAQRAVGIKMPRAPLPKAAPGAELEWVRDGSEPRRQPFSSTLRRTKRVDAARPDTHRLLVGAREQFDKAREDRDERYVRPYKRNIVDIFVSRGMLDRAIAAANKLFLGLEERGMHVMLEQRGHRHLPAELRVGEKPNPRYEYYYYHATGRWQPGSTTVVVIGEVTIGLTLFEISEEVEAEYDSKLHKYVRTKPAAAPPALARRALERSPAGSSKHWLPSARLGLHAWATKPGVDWSQHWYEETIGSFLERIPLIVRELRAASSKIVELDAAAEVKRQEERRQMEAQQEKWRKEEAERRRQQVTQQQQEALARREKEFCEAIARWRLARDIRDYVTATQALLAAEQMRLTEDGPLEEELDWALAYAERIDPLTTLRESIASFKREQNEQVVPAKIKDALENRGAAPGAQPAID